MPADAGHKLFAKRLHDRAPAQGHGPRPEPVHALRQPVPERVAHGISPARPQPDAQLLVKIPKLVRTSTLVLPLPFLRMRVPVGLKPRSTAPMYRFRDASQ